MKKNIGNSEVSIHLGDMTQFEVDGFVVPQFNDCCSFGGVGGSVARNGAVEGMEAYESYTQQAESDIAYGKIVIVPSGGGNSQYLLHAVTVASGSENEFETIQNAIFNALKASEKNGLESVAMPAMGTGILGDLTDEQSAKAMLSGVYKYSQESDIPVKVSIVIWDSQETVDSFSQVLASDSYVNCLPEKGERAFDWNRWVDEINMDMDKNAEKLGHPIGHIQKPGGRGPSFH